MGTMARMSVRISLGAFSIVAGNTLPGGVAYVAIDYSYSPSAVPEPGSMVLAGLAALGMAGMGWRQRRRRAAAQPDINADHGSGSP